MEVRDMRLVCWAPGDETLFRPRADMAIDMAINRWTWTAPPPGYCWTLKRGFDVKGIVGLARDGDMKDGIRWNAWAFLGQMTAREIASALVLAREAMAHARRWNRMDRITAQARLDVPGARKTLERLGFTAKERLALSPYVLMEKVF